jgi:hypothetical protein
MSAKKIVCSRWFGTLFLLPALIMVLLHRPLGVSNALLLPRTPEDLYLREYNLVTIGAIYLGCAAFILHSLMLARDPLRSALYKIAALLLYWVIIHVLICVLAG